MLPGMAAGQAQSNARKWRAQQLGGLGVCASAGLHHIRKLRTGVAVPCKRSLAEAR